MRERALLALSISIISLAGATSAFAQTPVTEPAPASCSQTVYGAVASNYPYQDLGLTGSSNGVAQGGYTLSCGNWSFDGWGSTGDTSNGNAGAIEGDVTISYATAADTPVGRINFVVSGAYYAFNFAGLSETDDDALGFYAEAARPIELGPVTVTPFARVTHIAFVNGNDGINLIRPGVRVSVPVTESVSMFAEVSTSMNITDEINTDRGHIGANWDVGDPGGFVLNAQVKVTKGLEPAYSVGFSWTSPFRF